MQGKTARWNQMQRESNNTSGLFWFADVLSHSLWSKRVVILQILLTLYVPYPCTRKCLCYAINQQMQIIFTN